MKKIVLFPAFVLAMLLMGCAKIPYVMEYSFVDYRPLIEKGFYVTESTTPAFDYDAIGSMTVRQEAGYADGDKITPEMKSKEAYAYKKSTGLLEKGKGDFRPADLDEALEYFRQQAVEKGANGAIKLDIQEIVIKQKVGDVIVPVTMGYIVSGMLIKIRE